MSKTETRLVLFFCAWKQARSWIFPEACKIFQTSPPNPVSTCHPNSFHVGALYKKDKNRKNYVHMFLCNILKDGFFFVHIVQRRKLVRYPGCQRVFFLLFAAKIKRRSRDRDEREKNPLFTIAASSLNFLRKQQGKKKPSGTQGTGTSAEWAFIRGRKVNFGVQEPFALF